MRKNIWEKYKIYGLRQFSQYLFQEMKDKIIRQIFSHSYSQNGEDLVIDRLLGRKRTGFYVDVGAYDPHRFSNTKRFYRRGWRGINIEPDTKNYQNFTLARKRDINLNIGIGAKEATLTFYKFIPDSLSTFSFAEYEKYKQRGYKYVASQKIKIRRLAEILKKYCPRQKIDFFSIDTEGFDLAVLQSNDWHQFRPNVICIEAEKNDQLQKYLQAKNYQIVYQNTINAIYLNNDLNKKGGTNPLTSKTMKVTLAELKNKIYPKELFITVLGARTMNFFYRKLSLYFTWLFLRLRFSANEVSVLSMIIILLAYVFFIISNAYLILASLLLLLGNSLDYVDGRIAAYMHTPSKYGAFLDTMIGILLPLAPASIGIGLYRMGGDFFSNQIIGKVTGLGGLLPDLFLFLGFAGSIAWLLRLTLDQALLLNVYEGSEKKYMETLAPPKGIAQVVSVVGNAIGSFMMPIIVLGAIFNMLSLVLAFYSLTLLAYAVFKTIQYMAHS